ncbi:MAG: isoleucine--tRNA ligase [Muribaculaceae bacterium]|nr:isoleucine--tRNA ligase [Muribaculaceae bacterium]
MKSFKEYSDYKLSDINKEMLERWRAEDLFHKSLALSEGAPSFVFYEGPPSANGMPGIHHVMARTIKDMVCRYKTMCGFHVERKAGWDTHGLPVELGVEKLLGITKEDIGKKITVDEYNAACRREVMKYTREWETLTENMGYWVDTKNPYITYDNRYIETVWWLLAQLYGKGLLYKGFTIQPYSPAAGTGLSTHELNQPGCYRDVKDTTCTALFELIDAPAVFGGWGKACLPAWTTTPWTLPSNTALCVGPNIEYSVIRTYNPYNGEKITIAMATALIGTYFKAEGADADIESYTAGEKIVPYRIVGTMKGTDLTGIHYRQLLPWVNPGEGAFRVIPGDYVSTDDGTGIVHIAGTFGADDLRVSRAAGVPPLHLVDRDGNIRPMVDLTGRFYRLEDLDPDFVEKMVDKDLYSQWAGRYVKEAYNPEGESAENLDVAICMDLKAAGKVFRIEKHTHSYPHCWRTDKPVLYYPLDSWFVRSTAMRDELMALNETIKWKPASTGTGRFGKWLENLQDWNLSRSRFWGTPLPIWRTEDGREEICIDSVATLYAEIDKAVAAGVMKSNPLRDKGFVPGVFTAENYDKIDLHRPYVDDIVLVSADGRPMHRETDLIDVWFDSGSMPYAQIHYPFENKEAFDRGDLFPADFIAEGVDQTRGWFFTLHAIGTMVFGRPAFKAVISNGLVLDKNGEKMSKRKGNAVDPFATIEKYGSDPVRWYMIATSAPWDNLKYDPDGVEETARKFFATLSHTYSFFAMYANVDGFTGKEPQVPVDERPEIDRWALSLLTTLTGEVTDAYEDYEPTRAARAIAAFVDNDLSNWYVRLNRKRFWSRGLGKDKLAAYQTLHTCLTTVSLLMAPIAPFYADRMYRDLTGNDSVHLAKFPVADAALVDKVLERRMELAQRLTSLVLGLRKKANIKVKQPLSRLMVPAADAAAADDIRAIASLVETEVNVKTIEVVAPDNDVFVKRVIPDFKRLGPKFGKQMKSAAEQIRNLDRESIARLEADGHLDLTVDGNTVVVELADVKIVCDDIKGWLVANEGALTAALDIDITPALAREGLAREIVNRVQNVRKSRGFEITDHISLVFAPGEKVEAMLADFSGYIASQVLADSVSVGAAAAAPDAETFDIDGLVVTVRVIL